MPERVVLTVGRDSRTQGVLRDVLEAFGCSVLQAGDAAQAHALLGHLNTSPDLVVADPATAEDLADDPRVLRLHVTYANSAAAFLKELS